MRQLPKVKAVEFQDSTAGNREEISMRVTAHRTTPLNSVKNKRPVRIEPERIRIYVVMDSPALQERIVKEMGTTQNWEVLVEEPVCGCSEQGRGKGNPLNLKQVVLTAPTERLQENATRIHAWKLANPEIEVILLGGPIGDADFLMYVRAGVRGVLPPELSGTEITNAIRMVLDGGAVCESGLCAVLFRYFAQEAESFPSATLHRDLGLTRREQQLIPLLTRGLTNKEIANHFSLAEQTVKNHLYRMKRKIGAHGRLEIVDVCRQHGFLA